MYVAALAEEAVLRYFLSDQKGRYFGTCTLVLCTRDAPVDDPR